MKSKKYSFLIPQHPVLNGLMLLMMLFSVFSVSAQQLLNNGDTDGITLDWGQYSSTMDDFYVPGGGWHINRAETIGIHVDPAMVSEVEVAVWAHDNNLSEPNNSEVQALNVTNFQAVSIGRTFLDREEIKISVDFD